MIDRIKGRGAEDDTNFAKQIANSLPCLLAFLPYDSDSAKKVATPVMRLRQSVKPCREDSRSQFLPLIHQIYRAFIHLLSIHQSIQPYTILATHCASRC